LLASDAWPRAHIENVTRGSSPITTPLTTLRSLKHSFAEIESPQSLVTKPTRINVFGEY
jgi:hypothetical protein